MPCVGQRKHGLRAVALQNAMGPDCRLRARAVEYRPSHEPFAQQKQRVMGQHPDVGLLGARERVLRRHHGVQVAHEERL
ncbi:hypothetical protein D3C72_2271320 [compost metagenome]